MVCEISQPKRGPWENCHWLRNNFATLRHPLRNQGLAAKRVLRCEIISQPHSHPLRKFFSDAKHSLAHECHFAALPPHFATAKWAAKWPAKTPLRCKIDPLLRKRLSVAKTPTVPWPPFLNVINSKFHFQTGHLNFPLMRKKSQARAPFHLTPI